MHYGTKVIAPNRMRPQANGGLTLGTRGIAGRIDEHQH